MTECLKSLVHLAFDKKKASFDRILKSSANSNLSLSSFVHCTQLNINENHGKKNESVKINLPNDDEQFVDFLCNRPFIYIIHLMNCKRILFIGRFAQIESS